MRNRGITTIALFIVMVFAPAAVFAQFGGFGKKKKSLDTKPITKLIKDIEGVVGEYEEATLNVWTATETVQETIKPYFEGEFPVLTKPLKEIKKDIKEAKDDAAKAAAIKLHEGYFTEMEARKLKVEELLNDPVKTTDIKGKLQPPELKNLSTIVAELKPVPEKDTKLIARSPELVKKAAEAVVTLTKAVKDNPLKAGDYKKLIDKLNALTEELNKMPAELKKQIGAIENMLGNIHKLVTKDEK